MVINGTIFFIGLKNLHLISVKCKLLQEIAVTLSWIGGGMFIKLKTLNLIEK